MSLASLYRGMLTVNDLSQEAITTEMQQRIHQYASKTHDHHLMAVLAHYPWLAKDVDDKLRESEDLTVLVAWATRPGRDSEELSGRLLGDKRVSALLPLAALPNLGAEVYQTIARVDSVKLAEVLAGNTSVPLDIRAAKVRQLVSKSPRGAYNDHVGKIHKICRCSGPNTPDQERRLYETIADTTKVIPYIIACLDKPYVRAQDLDRWIENLASYHEFDNREWQMKTGDLVTALSAQALTPGQRLKLLENAKSLVNANQNGWYTHGLKRAVETLGNFDENVAIAFSALDNATSTAEFKERLEHLKRICSRDDMIRVGAICARNPYATGEIVMANIEKMSNRNDIEALAQRLEAAGDIATLVMVTARHSNDSYPPMVVRHLENPKPVLDTYIERLKNEGRALPNWFAETDYIKTRPDLLVNGLQWSRLAKLLEREPALVKTVEATLIEQLGDAGSAWEALNTLAESFDGTLVDLVGAAQALSA